MIAAGRSSQPAQGQRWFSYADEHIYKPSGSEKDRLDELHKIKIDISDRIFVIGVDGYIGESTRGEIAYAQAKGLPVDYYTEFNFPESPASLPPYLPILPVPLLRGSGFLNCLL